MLITMIGQLMTPSKDIMFKWGHFQSNSINRLNNAHSITILFYFKQQPDSSLGLPANLGGKYNLIFTAEKVGSLKQGY